MGLEVFNLPRLTTMAAETKHPLDRLGRALQMDPLALISKYDAMVPLANGVAKEEADASCLAWARARC